MPPIIKKEEAHQWQEHLNFLLPKKELLRADEVAAAFDCNVVTVWRLYESGTLVGHDINAATGQRQSLRYRRDSVLMFLAQRANYTPEDMLHKMRQVLSKLPTKELLTIQGACSELLRRKM